MDPGFHRDDCALRSHLLWLSALLTSFEVMSTIWIMRS
jgi:hypothetical protein